MEKTESNGGGEADKSSKLSKKRSTRQGVPEAKKRRTQTPPNKPARGTATGERRKLPEEVRILKLSEGKKKEPEID